MTDMEILSLFETIRHQGYALNSEYNTEQTEDNDENIPEDSIMFRRQAW